jgi:hypothetical protein
MATDLTRNFTPADQKIWKGGARLATALKTVVIPATPKIEDFYNPATFALVAGWTDIGALSDDGIAIAREWDESEGLLIDQRDYPLRGGQPQNVRMSVTATLVYTDLASLDYLWQTGTTTVVPTSPGVNVAQTRLTMGETKALDEKHVLILQQTDVAYPTSAIYRLRIFFFRLGVLAPPNGISLSSRAFSRSEFTIRFRADPTITDGSEYGFYIEQTGA